MLQPTVAPAADTGHSPERLDRDRARVAELTLIVPLKAGGAGRLRAKLRDLDQQVASSTRPFGPIRDWRFVIFDSDTRLLLATTYEGEWDQLIDDVAGSMWPVVDLLFAEVEGYPGFRAPQIKAWIVEHQVTAASWYGGSPAVAANDRATGPATSRSLENLLDGAATPDGRRHEIARTRDRRASPDRRPEPMVSTCRMTQISGSSPESWEAAVQNALARVDGRLRHHWMAEILGLDVTIVDGKVAAYRARLNVCSWDEGEPE